MITPERVYKVFGFDRLALEVVSEDISNLYQFQILSLIKSSPEMFVALINCVMEIEFRYTITGGFGTFGANYTQMVKAIESADSQNRSWVELKKELEE